MKLLTATIAAILFAAPSFAIEVSEIINRTNHTAYYQGSDGKAKVHMDITDSAGRTRTRDFIILRKDLSEADEDQNFFVYFRRPADVNKTVFLVKKHVNADDDRWLYLPALDLVKRIAAGDKRTSFVGSNFFYEDVSGRAPSEDTHELTQDDGTYYVLKSTPKKPEEVEFAYYTSYIHKTTFIPVKVTYYDSANQPLRTSEALGVATINGYPTVTQARVTDHKDGSSTTMNYEKVEYDIGVPEDIFSERYLRNPPRKLLR